MTKPLKQYIFSNYSVRWTFQLKGGRSAVEKPN